MSGSVFGSYSIADRLKAAVNTLEQTGSSLQAQARAMGQQGQNQGQGSSSRPQSPSTTKSSTGATGSGPNATTTAANGSSSSSPPGPGTATSPTKAAGHYISQAGDAFTGLRKSLHLARTSFDGGSGASSRPGSSSGPSLPRTQELKDIPHLEEPRPDTPSRLIATQFGIGSDPSSMSGTPRPRSPAVNAASIPLPRSPAPPMDDLPPPDPSNPASYPLPPSPSLSPLLTVPPTATFADPLGASPNLHPRQDSDPPDIVLSTEEATGNGDVAPTVTDDVEKPIDVRAADNSNGVGLGINGLKIGEKDVSAAGAPQINGSVPEISSQKDILAMERRYEDLSQRFTNLLTQKHNADKILKELTPLEGGIADHEALEGWVRMMNGKVEMITEEMKRLQGQINLQGARMEEIRDTHRLEGSSQSDQITKLRTQLSTAESNLASKATELLSLQNIRSELTKAQTSAKEEEEKRTKAISLLKTVRMKLVKVEKEKEEIERDRAEERAERSTARDELEKYRADREREVTALRRGFEKELSGQKERHEKDLSVKKAAWELEMITTKATHAKELSGKSTKVNGLEAIVKELNVTNSHQFEEIQSRQSEVESSRSELEALRSRTKDLEFQLREVNERCALLEDSVAGPSTSESTRGRNLLNVPGDLGARSATPSPSRASSVEIQRLLAEAEARSESKLADLRHKIRSLEGERNSLEEEWASKLAERVRELERSKRTIQEKDLEYAESLRGMKDRETEIEHGGEARKGLEREIRGLRAQLEEGKEDVEAALDAERLAKDELSDLQNQISDLRNQLEESKTHATNLKTLNKTLREELRKVQSSVQLMERQRNPGVGYWSSTPASGSSAQIPNHVPPPRSGVTSPGEVSEISTPTKERGRQSLESSRSSLNRVSPGSTTRGESPAQSEVNKDEEEVNLEYLRNVILQFLEHKEMRPNLVRVLSVILRFTPQELRRLNAKLLT